MKLGELLGRYEEWRLIIRLICDMYDASRECKDGSLNTIARQLMLLTGTLASKPVELDPVELAEVERA